MSRDEEKEKRGGKKLFFSKGRDIKYTKAKPSRTTVVVELKIFARVVAQVNLWLVRRVANRLAFEHPRIQGGVDFAPSLSLSLILALLFPLLEGSSYSTPKDSTTNH